MVLACALEDNRLLDLLPLIKYPGKSWDALKHRYTPHFSLLLADGAPEQALTCLVEDLGQLPVPWVVNTRPASWAEKLIDLIKRSFGKLQ